MGLMHLLLLPSSVGYDINPNRRAYAANLGLDVRDPADAIGADTVFVCPGNKAALDFGMQLANPGATIVLFAPMPPGEETPVDINRLYFNDVRLVSSYSCGPEDTRAAAEILRLGIIKAEQVVSDFIEITELPGAYEAMKKGDIVKPMVVF
jgi:L-iditol 2-dehydrogenase